MLIEKRLGEIVKSRRDEINNYRTRMIKNKKAGVL
jgi:hypothetical protein